MSVLLRNLIQHLKHLSKSPILSWAMRIDMLSQIYSVSEAPLHHEKFTSQNFTFEKCIMEILETYRDARAKQSIATFFFLSISPLLGALAAFLGAMALTSKPRMHQI